MSLKSALLQEIRLHLETQLLRLRAAALEAHAAATDPSSKAEGKYDTRSVEASYLASGQARQVDEAAMAVEKFAGLELPELSPDEPIRAGALVEAEIDGESSWFLLAPAAGGESIVCGGLTITMLTPDSQLYGKLLGLTVGEEFANPEGIVTEVL